MSAKYDPVMDAEAVDWIEKVLGEEVCQGKSINEDVLKDGQILCRLANHLGGDIQKINNSKMAFKMMENIAKFLDFCGTFGVAKSDLFQTVDLYEKQNIQQVINSIHALARKANSKGLSVPILGPKESQKNPREFTEEQKRAGEGVIGLQMGSNKGASQAGDTFGRPRQVAGNTSYPTK
ncbi:predicted protein [Nematostella vectensis]|uniref:Transgelin n=1 Tax=Nematostella vectensis TaxID=45351 RepID=A7T059_NEMVE|nr:predicted protein [Nematostella vectensis]|eukprot:XP_001622756.1 predicted protein [Nematostella vectensis]